jgi:hypothetical protein
MQRLLNRLSHSVDHLKILDEVYYKYDPIYKSISDYLNSSHFASVIEEVELQLYAGGKKMRGLGKRLMRQMILGDLIQYIFTGRAFYYATSSDQHLKDFTKLLMYTVNQLLIFDSITVDSTIRKKYIEALESKIPKSILFEKPGDEFVAKQLKTDKTVIDDKNWTSDIDLFIDSLLPKTLGNPKELVMFAELIRLKRGIIIPLLLIQRTFGIHEPIAPPDFLIIKPNKDIFGIEVGYAKEGQSREFSLRTSIPTLAVDLKNNLHNRCPKCGKMILYCDRVIDLFSDGTLLSKLDKNNRFRCKNCPAYKGGNCPFANFYGYADIKNFRGELLKNGNYHFHASCVYNDTYLFRKKPVKISTHSNEFFAQIPEIQGLESL